MTGVSRNPNLGRPTYQIDGRLMKTFQFYEGRAWLQFGIEAFNILNHTNPVSVSEFAAGPLGPIPSYGALTEAVPARQLQFFIQWEY